MRRFSAPLGAFLVLVAASCGGSDTDEFEGPDPGTLRKKVAKARVFHGPVQYWAGNSVGELVLDDASLNTPVIRRNSQWSFFYGECEPFETDEYGTLCNNPVEVQNWSVCKRWPKRQWRGKDVRGAHAVWRWSIDGLEVVTGRTTVVIFAERKRAFRVAQALRPVHQTQPMARLRPPALGALTGDLPCQQKTKRPIA